MIKVLVVSTDPYINIEERLDAIKKEFPEKEYEFYIVNEVFGSDPPEAPRYSNYVSLNDFADEKQINQVMHKVEQWAPFDKSVQTDEYAVSLLGKLNHRFNIDGLTQSQAESFRDKVRMKQMLGEDIAKPRLYGFADVNNENVIYPVIVKPRSFAASKGVFIAQNKDSLLEFIQSKRLDYGESALNENEASVNDIEMEDYIDADVYHVDGIIYGGDIVFCTASKYIGSCLNYAKGETLGSINCPLSEQNKWMEFVAKVHRDLKIPDGAFHLEAFKQNDNIIFLEIGARPGGAGIVPCIKAACNFDLSKVHILCQLGIESKIPELQNNYFGWLLVPKDFSSSAEKSVKAVALPIVMPESLYQSEIPEIGSPANSDITYCNTLGSFVFVSDNWTQLEKDIYKVRNEYKVVVG